MPPAQRSRRVPMTALVALCRWQLRRSGWGRLGWFGASVPLVLLLASGLGDGRPTTAAEAIELIQGGLGWSAWAGGGAIALAAAADRGGRDRDEGVELLAGLHGATRAGLARARWIAAIVEIALSVAVPWWIGGSILAMLVPSGRVAFAIVGVTLFALVAAVVTGGVACACGQLAGSRGRAVFVAVVLLPWFAASSWLGSGWSIPGVLLRTLELLSLPLSRVHDG